MLLRCCHPSRSVLAVSFPAAALLHLALAVVGNSCLTGSHRGVSGAVVWTGPQPASEPGLGVAERAGASEWVGSAPWSHPSCWSVYQRALEPGVCVYQCNKGAKAGV